jgi:hypothetical protein
MQWRSDANANDAVALGPLPLGGPLQVEAPRKNCLF